MQGAGARGSGGWVGTYSSVSSVWMFTYLHTAAPGQQQRRDYGHAVSHACCCQCRSRTDVVLRKAGRLWTRLRLSRRGLISALGHRRRRRRRWKQVQFVTVVGGCPGRWNRQSESASKPWSGAVGPAQDRHDSGVLKKYATTLTRCRHAGSPPHRCRLGLARPGRRRCLAFVLLEHAGVSETRLYCRCVLARFHHRTPSFACFAIDRCVACAVWRCGVLWCAVLWRWGVKAGGAGRAVRAKRVCTDQQTVRSAICTTRTRVQRCASTRGYTVYNWQCGTRETTVPRAPRPRTPLFPLDTCARTCLLCR